MAPHAGVGDHGEARRGGAAARRGRSRGHGGHGENGRGGQGSHGAASEALAGWEVEEDDKWVPFVIERRELSNFFGIQGYKCLFTASLLSVSTHSVQNGMKVKTKKMRWKYLQIF